MSSLVAHDKLTDRVELLFDLERGSVQMVVCVPADHGGTSIRQPALQSLGEQPTDHCIYRSAVTLPRSYTLPKQPTSNSLSIQNLFCPFRARCDTHIVESIHHDVTSHLRPLRLTLLPCSRLHSTRSVVKLVSLICRMVPVAIHASVVPRHTQISL